MCGIAGIIDRNQNPKVNREILKKMSDVIIHRGPDSEGQWMSDDRQCGLSFRRLSIIDLSDAGNQPMHSDDGRFSIVFNGEIYNHREIRAELVSRGYKYRSGTDTETILYGFREFGRDIVRKLTGMFAFAIWDNDKKELFAARDRIGIKPLYYYHKNGRLIFGSEIKSILQHPDVKTEMNLDQLPVYLNFGMSGNFDTMFRDIHKVSSGHWLYLNSEGELKVEMYWNPIQPDMKYSELSENEVKEELVGSLRQAIADRMMSDVPFGVFLSGGIDSSLNVALMHEFMDRPIDTYSVGFKELEKYNELEYARKISDIYNTNHNEILIDSDDALPILEDLAWHEDEPNADPVCMPLWFLSKLTRDSGTTVIQVGEGSDEQFVGYPWMMREIKVFNSAWKMFNSVPKGLQKGAYQLAKPFFKAMDQNQALDYIRKGAESNHLYWSGMPIFSPSHQEDLFTSEYNYLKENPVKLANDLNSEAEKIYPGVDILQRIAHNELRMRLSEILLMRVDKIGMAHSIEARVPFLDHRIVEFTMSLPTSIKIPDMNVTKYILKKAVEPILPHEIIYRKKQGFWAPVNEWLRKQWSVLAESEIMDSYLVKQKILDAKYISRLFRTHKQGKNHGLEIFTLFMLSIWYRRFFG